MIIERLPNKPLESPRRAVRATGINSSWMRGELWGAAQRTRRGTRITRERDQRTRSARDQEHFKLENIWNERDLVAFHRPRPMISTFPKRSAKLNVAMRMIGIQSPKEQDSISDSIPGKRDRVTKYVWNMLNMKGQIFLHNFKRCKRPAESSRLLMKT